MKPPHASLPRPHVRIRGYLRLLRALVAETRDQTRALSAAHELRHADVMGLATALADELGHLRTEVSSLHEGQSRLVELLRLVHDRALWRRERLLALRADEDYERAYADPEPLVTVVIPTFDNHELLRRRAIPSVLAQTYAHWEIVVVGDAAPGAARAAVESFADPRITYFNLPYRGPHPTAPEKLWLVSGTQPYNEGVRRARGQWIAPLDDDDAFRPDHIERLLAHARERRLEMAYGRIRVHSAGGEAQTVGRFPPELGHFNLQACLYHAGLGAVFELESIDAPLDTPNDWGWCRRLMEAGTRIGMTDAEVTDYYPSREWTPRWEGAGATKPEWEYVPEGWERARNGSAPRGWATADVARSYAAKWPRFLDAVTGPGPLGVGHEVPEEAAIGRDSLSAQNAVLAYAYALSRACGGRGSLSVLDWGGALGHFYVLARRLFPALELDYHCRELPAVCDEGRTVLPEVSFHATDDCLERRYDLVLASNALQYEEDWLARLRVLAAAAEGWLFLTRVPIVREAASFVTLQRADAYGYETEYLGWVLNRDDLLAAADGAGLGLEREFMLHPSWPVDGTPEAPSESGYLFAAGPGLRRTAVAAAAEERR